MESFSPDKDDYSSDMSESQLLADHAVAVSLLTSHIEQCLPGLKSQDVDAFIAFIRTNSSNFLEDQSKKTTSDHITGCLRDMCKWSQEDICRYFEEYQETLNVVPFMLEDAHAGLTRMLLSASIPQLN